MQGFTNSKITYDEDTEVWLLSSKDESVNGTSVTTIGSMGTGAQTWQFSRDVCDLNNNLPKQL